MRCSPDGGPTRSTSSSPSSHDENGRRHRVLLLQLLLLIAMVVVTAAWLYWLWMKWGETWVLCIGFILLIEPLNLEKWRFAMSKPWHDYCIHEADDSVDAQTRH